MRPQRVRIIGSSKRLGRVEEPVHRHVDDAVPLRAAHARQHRIIVQAGIVDQDLDRAGLEQAIERPPGGLRVGDVEVDRARGPAGGADLLHQRGGGGEVAVRVDVHVVAVARQAPAQRRADAAAAAGHQGELAAAQEATRAVMPKAGSMTMLARPSSTRRCALVTQNS